ncbi:unnamed protein product [Caenorhabditis auriculariae]|uniref:CHMP7 winged helix domain-containing protein n=1 Tax=Caenorhabditis auriculariae TaxID=2777116 RepID=A0A8S1HFJ7_9PELO|nr:unnamed protein product [Caenorhabditis auriculariae]
MATFANEYFFYAMETPSLYLPESWKDDVTMHSMMSVIKERYVNSVDHDRKIKFWSEAIAASCLGERSSVFDLNVLKRRFRRGDRIPASLDIVIEEMKRNGTAVSQMDWRSQHSGWIGWGISKTKSWMYGNKNDAERLIHLPTLKKQAERLLKVYNDELRSEVDCSGELIGYVELYDLSTGFICNTENFDMVLDHLVDIGELTIGAAKNGDKILKFKDISSKEPVCFTETDASLHDIRRAMGKVEKEINSLELKVKRYDQQCRAALRSGEKSKAANLLRQKKRTEKDISDKDGQYQRLLTMLHQISSAKHNRDVLDAYQSGTAAFKASLSRHGLSPDKIDEAMDEVVSSLDDYREIEEAMARPMPSVGISGDEDLEKELDDLVNAQKNGSPLRLPEAPTNKFGLFDEEETVEKSIEKRLQRLREAV